MDFVIICGLDSEKQLSAEQNGRPRDEDGLESVRVLQPQMSFDC